LMFVPLGEDEGYPSPTSRAVQPVTVGAAHLTTPAPDGYCDENGVYQHAPARHRARSYRPAPPRSRPASFIAVPTADRCGEQRHRRQSSGRTPVRTRGSRRSTSRARAPAGSDDPHEHSDLSQRPDRILIGGAA
jgi:hypothetical protein